MALENGVIDWDRYDEITEWYVFYNVLEHYDENVCTVDRDIVEEMIIKIDEFTEGI